MRVQVTELPVAPYRRKRWSFFTRTLTTVTASNTAPLAWLLGVTGAPVAAYCITQSLTVVSTVAAATTQSLLNTGTSSAELTAQLTGHTTASVAALQGLDYTGSTAMADLQQLSTTLTSSTAVAQSLRLTVSSSAETLRELQGSAVTPLAVTQTLVAAATTAAAATKDFFSYPETSLATQLTLHATAYTAVADIGAISTGQIVGTAALRSITQTGAGAVATLRGLADIAFPSAAHTLMLLITPTTAAGNTAQITQRSNTAAGNLTSIAAVAPGAPLVLLGAIQTPAIAPALTWFADISAPGIVPAIAHTAPAMVTGTTAMATLQGALGRDTTAAVFFEFLVVPATASFSHTITATGLPPVGWFAQSLF